MSRKTSRIAALLGFVVLAAAITGILLEKPWRKKDSPYFFQRIQVSALTTEFLNWTWKKKLHPSGGRYFLRRVELPVPQYFQGDDRWAADNLGPTEGTLGAEGCAITSVSMIFNYYGIQTDPQRLNNFLNTNGGYTPQGWLYWEKAAELAPTRVKHVYEDAPSYYLIDSNLEKGNPVIVRIRFKNGITHFVVIAGKDGWDYLIRDPGSGGVKGIYPLKEFGSDIEALRFYEPLETSAQR
jgi:hypothetical protein